MNVWFITGVVLAAAVVVCVFVDWCRGTADHKTKLEKDRARRRAISRANYGKFLPSQADLRGRTPRR